MTANLKSFVLSVIKPLLVSLRSYAEAREKNVARLVEQQNILIYQNETLIADLNSKLLDLISKIDDYNKQITKLTTSLYTLDDVKALDRRSKEVDYILGALYDLVYAKLPDAKLPDKDNPVLPGDETEEETVKTEAELEAEWRAANGIAADAELTEEQKAELKAYIDAYYADKQKPDSGDSGDSGDGGDTGGETDPDEPTKTTPDTTEFNNTLPTVVEAGETYEWSFTGISASDESDLTFTVTLDNDKASISDGDTVIENGGNIIRDYTYKLTIADDLLGPGYLTMAITAHNSEGEVTVTAVMVIKEIEVIDKTSAAYHSGYELAEKILTPSSTASITTYTVYNNDGSVSTSGVGGLYTTSSGIEGVEDIITKLEKSFASCTYFTEGVKDALADAKAIIADTNIDKNSVAYQKGVAIVDDAIERDSSSAAIASGITCYNNDGETAGSISASIYDLDDVSEFITKAEKQCPTCTYFIAGIKDALAEINAEMANPNPDKTSTAYQQAVAIIDKVAANVKKASSSSSSSTAATIPFINIGVHVSYIYSNKGNSVWISPSKTLYDFDDVSSWITSLKSDKPAFTYYIGGLEDRLAEVNPTSTTE